jgi:outer membrane protein insertion porin family
MRFRPLLAVIFAVLMFSSAFAEALSGPLVERPRVIGTSPLNENLVRVRLEAREGTPVERIDLEAERSRVLELGLFASVTVSIEDHGAGPIMIVTVVENPRIREIRITGSSLPTDELLRFIEDQNLLAAGSLLNTVRAQEARRTIQAAYRQAGLPFDVPVTVELEPLDAADEVIVHYAVQERVPVSQVDFEDSQVLAPEVLEEAFRPMLEAREFSIEAYQGAVAALAEAYTGLGYRGSGVSAERSELTNGVFRVRLRELRISSIDTTDIGVDAELLSLSPGDLFNYDALLGDVRRLAAGRTRDVRLEPQVGPRDEVRVVFRLGPPETAGPVARIELEGNTVMDDEELLPLLTLQPGETFTSALAEEDFARILRHYQEQGYLLVRQPDFAYEDGVYVQRLQEVRIRDYELVFAEAETRTAEEVVTRYLPPPGSIYNAEALRDGLRRFFALGVASPLDAPIAPTEAPDEVIVRLVLREESARMFRPELAFDTDTGLSAAVSYEDRNLFGEAHAFSAELSAQTTALGLQLGGAVSYSVPWLYLDALDFQEVPTSLSASLFSQVYPGQPLTDEGRLRAPLPEAPQQEVLIGDYLQRDTGLSFGVGRQIFANTTLSGSVRAVSTVYHLEPGRSCGLDAEGNPVSPSCTLPAEDAVAFLPQSGLSSFISSGVVYDDRDSFDFPSRGWYGSSQLGLGLGTDYRDPATLEQAFYNYQQAEVGGRHYLRLVEPAPGERPNHILAFRVNAGHQFGQNYPANRLFVVGQTPLEATQIRGYTRTDILPSRTYATSSAEYRYDFGLETFLTQTLIGIVFFDLGYASNVPAGSANLFAGAGLGLQLNLGVGGLLLPPLRFDYGFSAKNPLGVFGFRIGPVF